MKHYFFIQATTMYDGFEFTHNTVIQDNPEDIKNGLEEFCEDMFVHEDSGEEVIKCCATEITKEYFNIMKKYL